MPTPNPMLRRVHRPVRVGGVLRSTQDRSKVWRVVAVADTAVTLSTGGRVVGGRLRPPSRVVYREGRLSPFRPWLVWVGGVEYELVEPREPLW